MKLKIMNTYRKQGQGHLLTLGQRIIEKMENNPVFPDPPGALSALKQTMSEFQTALIKAKGRDKEMVSHKNDKKGMLLSHLITLEEYVMATCHGDRSLLLSSGFDVMEVGPGLPPSIEILIVELGAPGEATTRVRKIKGAIAYMHQYTTEAPGPDTLWFSAGTSYRYYHFTGLHSDKRYWFRVVVIGHGGKTAVSPVVSRVIQ